jgi:hypothetical protein
MINGLHREWTARYARDHSTRRGLAWAVGLILHSYIIVETIRSVVVIAPTQTVGDAVIFAVGAPMMALIALYFVHTATSQNILGDGAPLCWIAAWVFGPAVAAGLSQPLGAQDAAASVAFALASLLVLTLGLRIPPHPALPYEHARLDYQLRGRTRPADHDEQRDLVTDDRVAEEIAAAWVRRLGFAEARTTMSGADDGLDVDATGAAAQVKLWSTKKPGASDVRDLKGSSRLGQTRIFFSHNGYTQPAWKWASHPDNRVALFIMGRDGFITAVNTYARRLLWRAPYRPPASARVPTPFHVALGVIVATVLGAAGSIVLLPAQLLWCDRCVQPASTYFALGVLAIFGLGLTATARDLRRIWMALSRRRISGEWPGWRQALCPMPSYPDVGLPPDRFVGLIRPQGVALSQAKEFAAYLARGARRVLHARRGGCGPDYAAVTNHGAAADRRARIE